METAFDECKKNLMESDQKNIDNFAQIKSLQVISDL